MRSLKLVPLKEENDYASNNQNARVAEKD